MSISSSTAPYGPKSGPALKRDSPSESHPIVGQTLGDSYRILSELDSGGMGTLLVAEQMRLNRRVAIKVLARHLAEDSISMARFYREAAIISELQHPHIVSVLDFDRSECGSPYLVMELLQGETLADCLDVEGHLPLSEVVRIVGDVASALSAAHEARIVHRDLKPANIFLVNTPGEPPFVKLLDFGISKRLGRHAVTTARRGRHALTGGHQLLGTPEYMSPEQARGDNELVDARSDQFALAVIAFEMLAGRPPLVDDDPLRICHRLLNEALPTVGSVASQPIPAETEAVIARALAKDPADRFPSVSEMTAALLRSTTVAPERAQRRRDERAKTLPSAGQQASGMRPRTIESAKDLTHQVVASIEQARLARVLEQPLHAARHAEHALRLVEASDDPEAAAAIRLCTELINSVFHEQFDNLDARLEVRRVPSAVDTEMSAERAYLVSLIDGNATIREVLDMSMLPELTTLRALGNLLSDGVIGVADPIRMHG